MQSDRRGFFRLAAAAGAAGTGLFPPVKANARDADPSHSNGLRDAADAPFVTELFLDNQMLEVTPGVSRRLHPPQKHSLNPVVRPDRWCEGNYIEPYTTMYDSEDRLFKMWARAGSDWKSRRLDGNAAFMLYYTSADGVHWQKPDLGMMPIAGRRDHNIIFTSDSVSASPAASGFGNHRFVAPSRPMTPQGKKAFFWAVNKNPQPLDIQLAASRDGIHFTRVCRGQPFIPHGPLGYYDYMAMACSQPEPIIVDDTVYIYYAAANFPHDADVARTDPESLKIGAALATFKRDRFASLETSDRDPGPCRVVTRPFTVRHSKLFLNAATWLKGAIRVEALTRDWQPIPGFTEREARTIQGDALNHPVRWSHHADVRKLVGKEIRLKFSMTRARLHTMTLANQDRKLSPVTSEVDDSKPSDSTPTAN
jgi:hypothetical protein